MTERSYQQVSLADILASVPLGENDPFAEWIGMPEFIQDDLMPEFQLIVNFASIEDVEAFARLVEQPINTAVGEKRRSIWFPKVERQNRLGIGYVSNES